MTEGEITRAIQIEASRQGARLFRNQVGLAWTGRVAQRTSDTVVLLHPKAVTAGLCTDSSDLIGWHTVKITPEMVGTKVAIFTGVEIKTETGKLSKGQANWIRVVNAAGGRALVARNIEDLNRGLNAI